MLGMCLMHKVNILNILVAYIYNLEIIIDLHLEVQ